jgi:hypothetical protein
VTEPSVQWGFTPKFFGDPGPEDPVYWTERFAPGFGATQTEIPDKLTYVSPDEAAAALSEGYRRVVGTKPKSSVLALLLGQWAIETGNGKYVHNYNFGNVKRYAGAPHVQYFACSEIINGEEKWFYPPDPACAFAAYATAADGAEAYVKILKRNTGWWKGLQSGNVNTFNTALSTAPKYYTASPTLYLKGLSDRVNAYTPQAKKYGLTLLNTLGQVSIGASLAIGTLFAVKRYGNFPRY